MTLDQQREPALSTAPTAGAAQPARVLVAVVAGATQIGVVLDAAAPVSVQLAALVDLINARLIELGESALVAESRGRWALCRVDGTALKPARSLADQDVIDGTRLWLRFVGDAEARINVVEQITTAVAAELTKRWPELTPVWAGRVGASMAITGVLTTTALMGGWRYAHPGWLVSACTAALAAALIAAALIVLGRARRRPDRQIGDALLLTGCLPAALSAAAAVPGPLAAPHAAMGFATLVVAALLIVRFTGRYIPLGTAVVVVSTAALAAGLLRMLLLTSAVVLLTSLLLVALVGVHLAPTMARWASGIRLPVFPSASGRWIFETRPDLPAAVTVAGGEPASLDGPESVRDVAMSTDRAHGFLTGLLTGMTALLVVCCIGLCDPAVPRRWLPLLLAGLVSVALLLRGRSFTDRWQATILALAAVAIVVGAGVRYAVGLWTPAALLTGTGVILAVPVAGLVAAVVVPSRFYTPVFRKLVEWIEYLCLTAVFPLAFWLMGVLAAIRYR